jgi:hypothetical protein
MMETTSYHIHQKICLYKIKKNSHLLRRKEKREELKKKRES